MKVAIHDPSRVSSPKGNSPDLGKVSGEIGADGDAVGLTELKIHRIKLGYTSQMEKSKEASSLPTGNGS